MSEKIMTLHPEGKAGVNIDRKKYEFIKTAILDLVKEQEGITFKELLTKAIENYGKTFDGSVGWYVTTIKLDLEARGMIERIGKTSPQRLRLVT